MANVKTITLGGTEQKVIISGQNCDIRNDGADTVYASAQPNITAGADGVLAIPVGQAAKLLDSKGTVYLKGTGIVQLCGNDYGYLVFKCAATSSGEGGEVTKTYVDNGDSTSLLLAKQFAEESFSNPNLLINPDFKINQRGQAEYDAVGGYCVDCWAIAGDESTKDKLVIHSDHVTFQRYLNTGTCLEQPIESPEKFAGKTITLSALTGGSDDYSLRIRYNNTRETSAYTLIDGVSTFTITLPEDLTMLSVCLQCKTVGATVDVYWMKLELGSVATPFTPPDPATELAKCQRYYIPASLTSLMLSASTNQLFFLCSLPVKMRTRPSLTSDTAFKMYNTSNNGYIGDEADWTIYVHSSTSSLANGVNLALTKEAHGVTAGERYLVITSGGFSAEL